MDFADKILVERIYFLLTIKAVLFDEVFRIGIVVVISNSKAVGIKAVLDVRKVVAFSIRKVTD